jgi:hypothetical protein
MAFVLTVTINRCKLVNKLCRPMYGAPAQSNFSKIVKNCLVFVLMDNQRILRVGVWEWCRQVRKSILFPEKAFSILRYIVMVHYFRCFPTLCSQEAHSRGWACWHFDPTIRLWMECTSIGLLFFIGYYPLLPFWNRLICSQRITYWLFLYFSI